MLTAHEQYINFLNNWNSLYKEICAKEPKPYINWEDETAIFFTELCKLFAVKDSVDIWYAPQRSWYKPEMMEEIVNIARNPSSYEFVPNFCSGQFEWNGKQFLPSS